MLKEDLASKEAKVQHMKQSMANVTRKLRWHEDVRDCVSAALKSDLQLNDAVPLVPDWLMLKGHHIDSESE